MAVLRGKERAVRTLNFEEADRPPIWGGWFERPRFLEEASGIHMKYGFTLNEWEEPIGAAFQACKNVGDDACFRHVTQITRSNNQLWTEDSCS